MSTFYGPGARPWTNKLKTTDFEQFDFSQQKCSNFASLFNLLIQTDDEKINSIFKIISKVISIYISPFLVYGLSQLFLASVFLHLYVAHDYLI